MRSDLHTATRKGGVGQRHTGRRRDEAARQAILDATFTLLREGAGEAGDTGDAGEALTIDRIAAAAGVGRQTIYRWWPGKGAVVAEAMASRARDAPAANGPPAPTSPCSRTSRTASSGTACCSATPPWTPPRPTPSPTTCWPPPPPPTADARRPLTPPPAGPGQPQGTPPRGRGPVSMAA
ncbi:MAG: TetR family transcriptional regulator [Streptosporangiales bacterium]|nr:TetR family transcriptional regulator [Streptosporangiales bacterium]